MKKIVLYMHGGSGNHGCEALARTISRMIASNNISLYTKRPEEDEKYLSDTKLELSYCGMPPQRNTPQWFASAIKTKLFHDQFAFVPYAYKPLLKDAGTDTLAISIGGDNYCYDGLPQVLSMINERLIYKGAKTILFGCSIEPDLLKDSAIIRDLSNYSLITARESITYDALLDAHVDTDIVYAPDPAFTMDTVYKPLPDGFIDKQYVGINISPLILGWSNNERNIFDAFQNLVKFIVENTQYNVLLIPHVVWTANNDLIPLKRIKSIFSEDKRVQIAPDDNAMVLKGYIARCKYFIGARTHATIAAYSSSVPTICVGYSVKSRGIANDLFGTDKKYVVQLDEITDDNCLVESFKWLQENDRSIVERLSLVLPDYIKKAYIPAEKIKTLGRE